MSQNKLPDAVRTMLREHLRSFEELDILLFLQANAADSHPIAQISLGTRISPDLVAESLQGLVVNGLIERVDGGYRYQTASEPLADATRQLSEAVREQRAAVMSQMSANAIERIRSGTLRAFADSFLLNKRKGDG